MSSGLNWPLAMTILPRLKALGLTVGRFCALTDYSPATVYNWGKKRSNRDVQEVPRTVLLLLDAWQKHPDLLNTESAPPDST